MAHILYTYCTKTIRLFLMCKRPTHSRALPIAIYSAFSYSETECNTSLESGFQLNNLIIQRCYPIMLVTPQESNENDIGLNIFILSL